jgi:hypothetical protein
MDERNCEEKKSHFSPNRSQVRAWSCTVLSRTKEHFTIQLTQTKTPITRTRSPHQHVSQPSLYTPLSSHPRSLIERRHFAQRLCVRRRTNPLLSSNFFNHPITARLHTACIAHSDEHPCNICTPLTYYTQKHYNKPVSFESSHGAATVAWLASLSKHTHARTATR